MSGSVAALARKWLKVYGGFQDFGQVGEVFQKRLVIPDGAADPGPCAAKSTEVPALRFAPAGMTGVGVKPPPTHAILDLVIKSQYQKP